MTYEMMREILNLCSNNQVRDVFVRQIETDDTAAVARSFCTGKDFTLEKDVKPDGTVIYDLTVDGLRQRLSFTPD